MNTNKSYLFRSPINVQMEITTTCNARCVFCYNEEVNYSQESMTLSKAKRIIDELAKNKVFKLVFTGGEPLANNELVEMIRYASSQELFTGIITNGILLTEEKIVDLKKAGLTGVQVSILGSSEKIQDNITQIPGSFKKALKGLQQVVDSGMGCSVNTTVTRLNHQDIDSIINALFEIGVRNFSVTRYIHNDFSQQDNLSISSAEFADVIRVLLKWKDRMNVRIANCVPLCNIEKNGIALEDITKIMAPCDCAKTWIGIDVNGEVIPCPSFRYHCGNINRESLKSIWENNTFFKQIRDHEFVADVCDECKYINICGGGCKANNIDKFGNIKNIDPYIIRKGEVYA